MCHKNYRDECSRFLTLTLDSSKRGTDLFTPPSPVNVVRSYTPLFLKSKRAVCVVEAKLLL